MCQHLLLPCEACLRPSPNSWPLRVTRRPVQDADAAAAAAGIVVVGAPLPPAPPTAAPQPAAAAPEPSAPRGSSGGDNTGAIAGGVVGALVLLAALVAVAYFVGRRARGGADAPAKPDKAAAAAPKGWKAPGVPPPPGAPPAGQLGQGAAALVPGGGVHVPPGGYTVSPAAAAGAAAVPNAQLRAAPSTGSQGRAAGSLLLSTADTAGGNTTASWGAAASPPGAVPAPPAAPGLAVAPHSSASRQNSAVAANTVGETSPWVLPSTMEQAPLKSRLECALDNMAAAEPAEPFLRRWDLLPGRQAGGQAVVAFARDRNESLMECAIKCVVLLPNSSFCSSVRVNAGCRGC